MVHVHVRVRVRVRVHVHVHVHVHVRVVPPCAVRASGPTPHVCVARLRHSGSTHVLRAHVNAAPRQVGCEGAARQRARLARRVAAVRGDPARQRLTVHTV